MPETTITPAPAEPILPPPERPTRRGTFRYNDGASDKVGCAITIQFKLQDACPGRDISRVGQLLDALAGPPPGPAPDVEAAGAGDAPAEAPAPPPPEVINPIDAMMELAPIVGRGFDLAPYDPADGSGLNVTERIALLTDFYASFLAGEAGANEPDEYDPAAGPGAE